MSQSHDRRVIATSSGNAAPSKSRLESLPGELIETIAECLDTRSHKQLRLSSRCLNVMSTYTFGARLKGATFFFTRTSMEKLALLSESTRWSKYVNSLEIKNNTLDPSDTKRWVDYWRPHQEETYRDRSRRVPGRELHFEAMPAVQTLVVDLRTFYDEWTSLHCLLPALYAALQNLTSLELKHPHTFVWNPVRGAKQAWASLPPMPNLCHLCITSGAFISAKVMADILRTQKNGLRAVSISNTKCGDSWLEVFRVLRHELPLLDNIVFCHNWYRCFWPMKFNWSDGTSDFGQNAQRVIREKGVRRALDEMIDMPQAFQ